MKGHVAGLLTNQSSKTEFRSDGVETIWTEMGGVLFKKKTQWRGCWVIIS